MAATTDRSGFIERYACFSKIIFTICASNPRIDGCGDIRPHNAGANLGLGARIELVDAAVCREMNGNAKMRAARHANHRS